MEEWSEQTQQLESKKICWVEVHDVPLNYWCKDFFMKLGSQVGEVVWIDRATEHKQRLDIGKLLVLAPLGQALSCEIVVKVKGCDVPVKLVECQVSKMDKWINNQLGLMPTFSNLNFSTAKDGYDNMWSNSRRDFSSEDDNSPVSIRAAVRETVHVHVNNREKKDFRKDVRKPSLRITIVARKEVGGENVVLKKRKEETEYNSSGSDSEAGPGVNGLLLRGECSQLRPTGRLEVNGFCLGTNTLESLDYNVSEGVLTESGPYVKNVVGDKKRECVEGVCQSTAEARDLSSIQVVPETQMVVEHVIDLVVDLRGQDREVEVQEVGCFMELYKSDGNSGSDKVEGRKGSNSNFVKKQKGKCMKSSIKTHPMKTRRKVFWNLKEEISKFVERRVARVLEKEARLRGLREEYWAKGKSEEESGKPLWYTEEQVTKILETRGCTRF
ncbi:hypothetical protein QYF36_015477 [Acer negundo]|nr:hypothetical protein QYF36_015477 [Acer negundo]